MRQLLRERLKEEMALPYFINDMGEKVLKGHDYAWYLNKAGLKKPVDNL